MTEYLIVYGSSSENCHWDVFGDLAALEKFIIDCDVYKRGYVRVYCGKVTHIRSLCLDPTYNSDFRGLSISRNSNNGDYSVSFTNKNSWIGLRTVLFFALDKELKMHLNVSVAKYE